MLYLQNETVREIDLQITSSSKVKQKEFRHDLAWLLPKTLSFAIVLNNHFMGEMKEETSNKTERVTEWEGCMKSGSTKEIRVKWRIIISSNDLHSSFWTRHFNISRLAKEKLKKFRANIYTRKISDKMINWLVRLNFAEISMAKITYCSSFSKSHKLLHFWLHVIKASFGNDLMIAIPMWLKKKKSQQIAVS